MDARAATDVCSLAYGEVVWLGRRGAGAKPVIRSFSEATEAKEPFSGESTK